MGGCFGAWDLRVKGPGFGHWAVAWRVQRKLSSH